MNPKFTAVLAASLATIACNGQSVDGYDDVYIDTDKTITVHTLLCGDVGNRSSLRPVVVYTNSGEIEEAAYSFRSSTGDFTYVFKQQEADSPAMARDTLTAVKDGEPKVKQDVCIVKQAEALPAHINKLLKKDLLEPDAANWKTIMYGLAVVAGRPALSEGVYK